MRNKIKDPGKPFSATHSPSQALVKLDNLCHGLRKPCIVDFKMGKVLNEEHPRHKLKKQAYKIENSTSS